MKRIVSILLAALLLLIALPAFAAEETLKAGLYASESGQDVLYLDEKGVGILSFFKDGQFNSCGVVWTGTSLKIEREDTPFVQQNDILSFSYHGEAWMLHQADGAEDYRMGDRVGTAFY